MAGLNAPGKVVRVTDQPEKLPSRIAIPGDDMPQVTCGKAVFIRCEVDVDGHSGMSHQECAPGLGLGRICAKGAKLIFRSPGLDQVFIVTGYDADTDMWEAQWPD